MHGTKRAIASIGAIDHDAESEHVHDFRESLPLGLHLAVDGIQVLLTPGDGRLDAFGGEGICERLAYLVYQLGTIAARGADRACNALGAHRIERCEAEVLEFDAQVVHAEAIGDRRVELQGFTRDALALLAAERPERAHVVQAIREFYQNDANVLGHRHGHLLEVLGLGFGAGLEDGGELGDAVHDLGHFQPEACS